MEFNNTQHFICRCPFCSVEYDLDGAKVIGEEDESTMVYVTCSQCQSSIIAIVAMSGLGVVSLGLVTDMSEDDTKRFLKGNSVSSNELLSIYELLETNNSGAIRLLTTSEKKR